MSTSPRKIFVSYSRQDKPWLTDFQTQIKPFVLNDTLDVWDDSQIVTGSLRRTDIQNAIDAADVIVLLVTPNYLASDVMVKNELPPLLAGKRVFWIAVRASNYQATTIGEFECANDPGQPLSALRSAKRDAVWVEICKKLVALPAPRPVTDAAAVPAPTTTVVPRDPSVPYHSCFLAYAPGDNAFADRLYTDLQANEIPCWKDTEDYRAGEYEQVQISRAIAAHDKVIVICSRQSLTQRHVIAEILEARALQDATGVLKLFPIRLDDFISSDELQQIGRTETATGNWPDNWLSKVRAFYIPDFSAWRDPLAYQKAFQRLLRDLKTKTP